MTVRFGFYNSINKDRSYDALDMSSIFDGIIEDGVFATIDNAFKVSPGEGLQVVVDTGKAWFNHTWTVNDAPYPLAIDTPDIALDRYDAVVLEVNSENSVRANSLKVVKGAASSSPQKPALANSETVHQHPLAYVKVGHGVTSIQAKDIEITVGRGECPFVRGPLEVMSIDEIYAKWEQEFSDWFENVQSQMEGDIATNLQRQIDTIDRKEKTGGVYYKDGKPYAELYTHDGKKLNTPEGWQVGDVINTLRSEIDDKWALCNGQYIPNSGEYDKYIDLNPELLKFANFTKSTIKSIRSKSFPYNRYEHTFQVANNVYFIFVGRTTLLYSTNFASWNEVNLSAYNSQLYGARKISYIKGKYYIYAQQMGQIGASVSTTLTLLESSNLSDWSTKTINVDQTGVSSVYLHQTIYLNYLLELGGKVLFIFCPSESYSHYAKVGVSDNMDSTVYIRRSRIDVYGIKNGYHASVSQGGPNLARVIDDKLYFITFAESGLVNYIDVYRLSGYDVSDVASYQLTSDLSSAHLYDFFKIDSTYYLIHEYGILVSTDLTNWTNVLNKLGVSGGPAFVSSQGMIFRYPESTSVISVSSESDSDDIGAAFIQSGTQIIGKRSLQNNKFPYPEGTNRAQLLGMIERDGVVYAVMTCGTAWDNLASIGVYYFTLSDPFVAASIPKIPSNGANYFVKIKE